MAAVDASSIAPDTRSIAELLAERLEAAVGFWTLEFTYEDGRLRHVHRHERLGTSSLTRFDEPSARVIPPE